MNDNQPNFFGVSGYLTPEEIDLLRGVYGAIASEPWFTADKEERDRFAAHILEMYRRGLVLPDKLRDLCMAAARAKFSAIDCADRPLKGKRVLVAEDNWDMAHDIVRALSDCGATVFGPVGSVSDAMELLDRIIGRLNAALLDIRLGDGKVFPVAERLHRFGVPFAFVTGYDDEVPSLFAGVPRAHKPLEPTRIAALTSTMGTL